MFFCWFVHGGRARQRQYGHLIPLSTKVWRRWQIGWQGSSLGIMTETRWFFYRRLQYDFLACCLAFFFSSFSLPLSWYVFFFVLLSPCSSHLLLFSKYVFFLCHLYSVSSQYSCFICFIYHSSYCLGWRVCCAFVPGTLAFDLPTLINSRFFFGFLCLSLWPDFVSL